ncbi:MAG: hypothetical protein EYC68_06940 [Chloroflexota bacterium]|nr:MAG: hypothetical protein EYC68_06940 [Chloroflexota bacterium]
MPPFSWQKATFCPLFAQNCELLIVQRTIFAVASNAFDTLLESLLNSAGVANRLSIIEIGIQSGVSRSAMLGVISGDPPINAVVRPRMRSVRQKPDLQPNAAARVLAKGNPFLSGDERSVARVCRMPLYAQKMDIETQMRTVPANCGWYEEFPKSQARQFAQSDTKYKIF